MPSEIHTQDVPGTFSVYRFAFVYGSASRIPGQNIIEIPFTGYNKSVDDHVDVTGFEYSTNGSDWEEATVDNSGDLLDLSFSPDGLGYVINWDVGEDLEQEYFNKTLYFRSFAESDSENSTPVTTTSFIIHKETTSQDSRNVQVFPESYKGVSGSDLTSILKPVSR